MHFITIELSFLPFLKLHVDSFTNTIAASFTSNPTNQGAPRPFSICLALKNHLLMECFYALLVGCRLEHINLGIGKLPRRNVVGKKEIYFFKKSSLWIVNDVP